VVELSSQPGVQFKTQTVWNREVRRIGDWVTVVQDPRCPARVEVCSAWSVWRVPVLLALLALMFGLIAAIGHVE